MRSTNNTSLYVLVVVVSVTLLAIATGRTSLSSQPRAQAAYLEQPDGWVPFSAQVRVYSTDLTTYGRFYRSDDGSTRLETGPSLDELQVISIRNHAYRQLYAFNRKSTTQKWSAQPIEGPDEVFQPGRRRVGMIGLTKLEERVAVDDVGNLVLFTKNTKNIPIEQFFEAYRYINAKSGYTSIDVPTLNFFSVVRQNSSTGRREVYFDIHNGPQSAELFQPPAGSIIEQLEPPSMMRKR